jgi:hypothetical protein
MDVARQIQDLVQAFSFDNETLVKPNGELGFGGNIAKDVSGQASSGAMGGPEKGVLGAKGIAGDGLEFFGASHLSSRTPNSRRELNLAVFRCGSKLERRKTMAARSSNIAAVKGTGLSCSYSHTTVPMHTVAG